MIIIHLNSTLLFIKYALKFFKDEIKVLEIGPDEIPSSYRKKVKIKSIVWDTIDLSPNYNTTFLAKNEYQFPIEDKSYDIILSGQVIEHVRKIWIWIKELSRICKVGGHIITINPISYPYHEAPVDCWRIYPEGMKALYEEQGLKVVLSKLESLESYQIQRNGFRNIYYGLPAPPDAFLSMGQFIKSLPKKLETPVYFIKSNINYLRMLLGRPISCSLDVITIGMKEK